MSKTKYEDGCTGCEPAGIDTRTGEKLPPEHPASVGMMVAWAQTNRRTRKAWHAVTCLNSRRPGDLRIMAAFRDAMMREIKIAEDRSGAWLKRDHRSLN